MSATQAALDKALGIDRLKTDPFGHLALALASVCSPEDGPELNAVRMLDVLRASPCSDAVSENRELRILLAIAHAGLSLYHDDGELQDNRVQPFIDFKRDSVADIESKLRTRSYAARRREDAQQGEVGA